MGFDLEDVGYRSKRLEDRWFISYREDAGGHMGSGQFTDWLCVSTRKEFTFLTFSQNQTMPLKQIEDRHIVS